MASFAAAPEAASAASVMMPPISNFLASMGGSRPECLQKLSRVRRSLLASVQRLLEGPAPFLTGANVTSRGSVVVGEAAQMIFSAIGVALWAGGFEMPDDISRPAALMLQQCQALMVDSTIAAQLRERQRYPMCSLATTQPLAIAESLARLAEGALELVITYVDGIFNAEIFLETQKIDIVAGSQQQLLALSAAVTRPAPMQGLTTEPPGSVQQLVPAAYKGAALLANVAVISAAALDKNPSSICQPAGLAATVAAGAVAVLAFAPSDSSSGRRPPNIEQYMPGCMQYARHAAGFLPCWRSSWASIAAPTLRLPDSPWYRRRLRSHWCGSCSGCRNRPRLQPQPQGCWQRHSRRSGSWQMMRIYGRFWQRQMGRMHGNQYLQRFDICCHGVWPHAFCLTWTAFRPL